MSVKHLTFAFFIAGRKLSNCKTMKKVNGHGSQSSSVVIPTIIVTDYDAEVASQQPTKQEISSEITQTNQINNSLVQPRRTSKKGGEEVNKEIINSLTKLHFGNPERHVDVDESTTSITTKIENPSMAEELINVSVKHVEVDATTTSAPMTPVKTELSEKNVKLLTELPKVETNEKLSEYATDDELADLEVSQLTSLLESRQAFVPLPSSILSLQRPTKIVPMMVPNSKLPNISDIVVPQHFPVKNLSHESRRLPDSNAIPFSGESSNVEGIRSSSS